MGKKNVIRKSGGNVEMTPAQKAKAAVDVKEAIARNKETAYNYFLEDCLEAGPSLTGTEVKALRMSRASLSEAWAEVNRSGAWLQGVDIPEYFYGSWMNHSPRRERRLLLHKREILRLENGMAAKGYMVVPVELHFIGGRVKVEITLARGK